MGSANLIRLFARVCLNLQIIKKRLTRPIGHLQIDGPRLGRPDRSVLRRALDGVTTSTQIPVPCVRLTPKLRITRFRGRCRSLRPLKLRLLIGNGMVSIGSPNGNLMLLFSVQKMKMK